MHIVSHNVYLCFRNRNLKNHASSSAFSDYLRKKKYSMQWVSEKKFGIYNAQAIEKTTIP